MGPSLGPLVERQPDQAGSAVGSGVTLTCIRLQRCQLPLVCLGSCFHLPEAQFPREPLQGRIVVRKQVHISKGSDIESIGKTR